MAHQQNHHRQPVQVGQVNHPLENEPVTASSPLSAILATAGQAPTINLPTGLEPAIVEFNIEKLSRKKLLALTLLLQGIPLDRIAGQCGVKVEKVELFVKLPGVKHVLATSQKVILTKLQRGDFGPVPMAKHAAEHSMATLIHLTKGARNENVRRQAAIDVLALAGHVAVRKAEILNVNELIDAMAADELEIFIKDGIWPDRLRDRAALLSINKSHRANEIDITPSKS